MCNGRILFSFSHAVNLAESKNEIVLKLAEHINYFVSQLFIIGIFNLLKEIVSIAFNVSRICNQIIF